MSDRIIQNFRDTRALIVHRADSNRHRLDVSLQRLGLRVVVAVDDEEAGAIDEPNTYDVLFFDADEDVATIPDGAATMNTARIALVGVEAPSRLAGVVRCDCCSYLIKPIRASGVYTALFIAVNEHRRRRRQSLERERLTERLQGRRVVTKAILKRMRTHGVDDDEAFRNLREDSMRLRMSLEATATLCLEDDPPSTARVPQLNRRTT